MSTADEPDDERRAKGLPRAPSLPGQTPAPANPPTPVRISFWLWVTSGAVFVAGYLILFLARGRIVDQLVKNNTGKSVSVDQLTKGTTVLLAVFLAGAVCFAVLYVLFAYKARQGTRSARAVLTALVAINLVFQVVLQVASVVTLLATLIALIALALLYLPNVAAYFPKAGPGRFDLGDGSFLRGDRKRP